jgi:class 3 adenylate cyclase
MPSPRRTGISLRTSLALGFGVLALVTTAALGAAAYLHTSRLVEADLRDRLHDILGAAVAGFDGRAHANVQTEKDRGGADHAKITAFLGAVQRASPEIRYAYTMRRVDGKLRFIVDPDPSNTIGAEYAEASAAQLGSYERTEAYVEPQLIRDRWGTWLSGTAPIYVDGKLEAVLGIDIAAQRVEDQKRAQIWGIAIACVLVGIGAVLAGAWIAGRIAKPLVAVEEELARLRMLELGHAFALQSRIREVGNISSAVVNMKNGLRSFRKYVPAQLVADIIRSNEEARVSARRAELTILFSDVASFTTISEKLTPEEVVRLLERYLAGMSRTLLDHAGTIDKFIGDAVMGFWGAPRPVPGHPILACRAALACIAFLEGAREGWERDGLPPLTARIGLHTGEVVVGNIGFDERLAYTIIGDDVNLASRIEGINKHFGTAIAISEATLARTEGKFATRKLGEIVVKGRARAIGVHELIAAIEDVGEDDRAFAAQFGAALAAHDARDFAGAVAGFAGCAEVRPGDKASALYLARCRGLVEVPPGPDWTPAITMTDK